LTATGVTHKPIAGLFVVGIGASLAAMDLAVNVAFPSITAAFELETREIRWLVVCYVLTYASLMLGFGRLGDLIGHRRVFRAGVLLAVVAYTLCALAPDYGTLLVARCIQGISTALVLSCAPALATLLFEEGKRTRVLGAYASMSAIASIVAPLVGGMSIAALGWAGVFWFRVPVALLATLLLPVLPALREPIQAPRSYRNELVGSILLATGLALFLLSFTLALSAQTALPAVFVALVGSATFALFASQQRRVSDPILPRALFRDPDFWLPCLASVVLHFAVFAVPLLVPYYLERIAALAPLASGAALACSPSGVLIGSLLAATIIRRVGARRAALLGCLLVVGGQFAVSLWTSVPALALILISLAAHGAGMGLFSVAYTDIVVAALPRHDRGVAGSLTMLTRTIGVITAAAALTALLSHVESQQLALGQSTERAFLDAFSNVFFVSGLLLAALLPLARLHRRS
jgi:MFS family permease